MKKEIEESICIVQCGDRSGTAFLLNDNIAITAYHVIADCENGKAINLKFTSTKKTFEADYITSDEKYKRLDVALLSVKGSVEMKAFLQPAIRQLDVKQKWCSRGYPMTKQDFGENLISDDNIINQIFNAPERGKFDIQLDLSLKFDTYEGLSGAPLIIGDHLVGLINTQFDQNGTVRELYALSLKYFEGLLVNNGITVLSLQNASVVDEHDNLAKGKNVILERKQPLNFLLLYTLMKAIAKTDEQASKDLLLMSQEYEDKGERIKLGKVRGYIDESFFAVFGVQKLIAIGNDVLLKKDLITSRKYLDHVLLLIKHMLRFSCFILLSELWNLKEDNDIIYTEKQRAVLTDFFDYRFSADISMNFEMLRSLLNIFHENRLIYPIAEFSEFLDFIDDEHLFGQAIGYLTELEDQYTKVPSLEYCCEVEDKLCVFLSHFWFITQYRMISVKGIRYDEMHKTDKYFIHRFCQLVPRNSSPDTRGYDIDITTTDSIIVYKKDYKTGINLFPFLIDINALKFEDKSKIYFFNRFDVENSSLHYLFMDDHGDNEQISGGHISCDLNTIVKDKEKHRQYKFEKVYAQFQIARNTILS